MAETLDLLEDWAGPLLQQLDPAARRQLMRTIARELRPRQAQRIKAQQNPDGTVYDPRKNSLRALRGRIRRGAMFTRIRTARWLKMGSTSDVAWVGFVGRVANIARVHQYGLRDRVRDGGPTTQYPRRELIGFTAADIEHVRALLLQHLSNASSRML